MVASTILPLSVYAKDKAQKVLSSRLSGTRLVWNDKILCDMKRPFAFLKEGGSPFSWIAVPNIN